MKARLIYTKEGWLRFESSDGCIVVQDRYGMVCVTKDGTVLRANVSGVKVIK
jgi:hypothetical protein